MPSKDDGRWSGGWLVALGVVIWAVAATPSMLGLPNDEIVEYPYMTLVEWLPVPFCLWWMRTDYGPMRARWMLFATSLMLRSASYVPSAAQQFGWVQERGSAWVGTALWAISVLVVLLSITVFSERTTKGIRWIDGVQTSALCLVYLIASCSGSGFSKHHLAVGHGLLLFQLAVALAAYFEVRGSAAALFPGTLVFYFAARTVTHFITNVWGVWSSASWAGLVIDLALPMPSLALCWYAARQIRMGQKAGSSERARPDVLRSLLPLMVTVSGVLIAPVACRTYPLVSSGVVLLFVGAYATRTHLLYRLIMAEQQTLEVHAGRLERLASEDALTGLRNRRWFEEKAGEVLGSGPVRAVSLLLVDTDRFKEINDTYGHRQGDRVLRAVAGILREEMLLLEAGQCARIGGDEFAALLPGVQVDEAAAVAERVRVRVHELLFESGQLASVSIGVAEGRSGMGLAQLLEFADVALYQAKGAGRNAVRTSTIPAEAAGRVSRGARRISSGVQRAELPFRSFPAVRGS